MTENPVEIASKLSRLHPLFSLEAKVGPAHTALLVIDMQNDFCSADGHIAKSGKSVAAAQEIARRLPPLLVAARRAGVLIVFVRNVYSTDHNFYLSDVWLEHAARKRDGGGTRIPFCAANSWGGDFYGDLQPQPGDAVVAKHRYSAFYNTDLDTILRARGIRTIVLTGAVTNVCVETTAREGYVRDYYVVLVEDGTAAYTPEDQAATVGNVARFFGSVSTVSTLEAIWAGSPSTS